MQHNEQYARWEYNLRYLPDLERAKCIAYVWMLAVLFYLIRMSEKKMRAVLVIEFIAIIGLVIAILTFKSLTFGVVAGTAIGIMVGGSIVALLLGRFIHHG